MHAREYDELTETSFWRAAAAKVASEARGAEGVRGAERRHGQPAAHLHGGLHGGRPCGAGAGQVAMPVVRDVPGPAAAHPPLLPVPEPRQLPPVPAHVAAAPPPRRALPPPRRPLQHPSLHVSSFIPSLSYTHSHT
jgi:hypothetical protein